MGAGRERGGPVKIARKPDRAVNIRMWMPLEPEIPCHLKIHEASCLVRGSGQHFGR